MIKIDVLHDFFHNIVAFPKFMFYEVFDYAMVIIYGYSIMFLSKNHSKTSDRYLKLGRVCEGGQNTPNRVHDINNVQVMHVTDREERAVIDT